jgi:hypothetical protein
MDEVLDFAKRVLHVRMKWDFSVTSWGRTPKRNVFVKGVTGSLHMMWTGMDVVLDDQLKNVDFEKDCASVGLQAIYEQDHYHLQPSG